MLKGIDISRHNKHMKCLHDINKYDFVIMKVSEGKGYKDDFYRVYTSILDGPVKGYYHFARPELNNPIEEANNFISAVKPYLNEPTILALDVEDRALSVPFLDNWCLVFIQYVESKTGIKPLIYCSASETRRFKKCAAEGAGLWVAKWGKNKPTKKDIAPWDIWAIWQYTSSAICSAVRVDEDYFNGTVEQLKKYGVNTNEEAQNDISTDSAKD